MQRASAGASRSSTCPCARCCSACSRCRPVTISKAGSRAIRSRPCSVSMASSATTRARTRPGRRTCCCITCSARSTARKAHGVMRSAAWARSRRRWRNLRPRAASTSASSAGVREVIVEGGRAVGVVTESGETFRASAVVSNLNPRLLYLQLIDPAALPAAFREHIGRWRCGSGTFRMNVALSELPDFTCLPGKARGAHHTAGIIIAPTLGVHGARVLRCPFTGLVEAADRGDPDSIDAR